ncbi:hypothetical protein F4810DRAFT_345084 [Camillea tinctor]|nr:hypothetical protein F4810DRAFT_345084 [Camillea tinctor]
MASWCNKDHAYWGAPTIDARQKTNYSKQAYIAKSRILARLMAEPNTEAHWIGTWAFEVRVRLVSPRALHSRGEETRVSHKFRAALNTTVLSTSLRPFSCHVVSDLVSGQDVLSNCDEIIPTTYTHTYIHAYIHILTYIPSIIWVGSDNSYICTLSDARLPYHDGPPPSSSSSSFSPSPPNQAVAEMTRLYNRGAVIHASPF